MDSLCHRYDLNQKEKRDITSYSMQTVFIIRWNLRSFDITIELLLEWKQNSVLTSSPDIFKFSRIFSNHQRIITQIILLTEVDESGGSYNNNAILNIHYPHRCHRLQSKMINDLHPKNQTQPTNNKKLIQSITLEAPVVNNCMFSSSEEPTKVIRQKERKRRHDQ